MRTEGTLRTQVMMTRGTGGAPAVSIIMPAYRCADYIGAALDSVLAQTFGDYEIIVVNDGSPDTEALERVLAPYRERIVYLTQENLGVSAARNTAIRAARAPFVALLDPDDLWEPDYLAVQVAAMRQDPAPALVYPDSLIFGDVPQAGKTNMELNPSHGEVTFERLIKQQCTVLNNAIVRRDAIIRAGWFDESLSRAEDFDLWLRILRQGGRIVYHRRALARYRRHAGSLSSDPALMLKDLLRVLDKAGRTFALNDAERELLQQERTRYHALMRFHEGKGAFIRGDARAACAGLTEANRYFNSRKTTLAVVLLRIAPKFLLRLYDLRDRFVFRASTRY